MTASSLTVTSKSGVPLVPLMLASSSLRAVCSAFCRSCAQFCVPVLVALQLRVLDLARSGERRGIAPRSASRP